MELTIAIVLSFLETTFITVTLLILHGLRNQIGKVPFYLSIGGLFVLTQIIAATELKVIVGFQAADYYISGVVLFLPLLAAVMLVYITEGTLATQRLIIGTILCFFLFVYVSYLTAIQCTWNGFRISQGPTANSLEFLLDQSLRSMTGSILALAVDLFLIPIFYQRLRNLGARLFFAVLGALMLTQIADSFIFITVTYWNDPLWWSQISSSYIAKAVVTVWLSILMTIYLSRIEKEIPGEGKSSLDVLFAFLGSYGRAKALQKNLLEWEGRYKMVVENASDMILIVNRAGKVLDANPAARKILKFKKIVGQSFVNLVESFKVLPCQWEAVWSNADSIEKMGSDYDTNYLLNRQLGLIISNDEKIEVDASFSITHIRNNSVLIVACRNITEQQKLVKDKEELTNQLYHAQRLESMGRLAGGISHEFNNILHAIQGHVDLVLLFKKVKDESVVTHLESVTEMVNKAGNITAQLLGFARKGKYNETSVDLIKLLNGTKDMFLPMTRKTITLNMNMPDYECVVRGDSIQLQQVFLNLLINGMDAVQATDKKDKELNLSLCKPLSFPEDWKPLKADALPGNYFEIQINDNGIGMDEKISKRIFEPFYTTKEVGKGTGMGLAMVYGEITGHNGFIHVASKKNIGTTFYIYLPSC
ncbi:MAG: PAS domain-containing protein [bacterium]|nr:PAS domain-containing protein [bacterium]